MSVVSPRTEKRFREREAMRSVIARNWPHRHDSEPKRRMLRAAVQIARSL